MTRPFTGTHFPRQRVYRIPQPVQFTDTHQNGRICGRFCFQGFDLRFLHGDELGSGRGVAAGSLAGALAGEFGYGLIINNSSAVNICASEMRPNAFVPFSRFCVRTADSLT